MKRTLCIATIMYILGILIGLYLKISIVFYFIFVLIAFIFFVINKKKLIVFILIIFIGITYVKSIDNIYANKVKHLDTQNECKIKAIIMSGAREKEYKIIYKVKVIEINGNKEVENTYWYLNIKKSVYTEELKYGDIIEVNGKIELPSEERNFKGFNYKQYLKTQKIYGNIIIGEKINIVGYNKRDVFGILINKVSKDMKDRIYKLLPDDLKELCIGILIGERSDISKQINEAFKDSNLTHMLAVSGSHISYIVVGLSILLSKNGKRFRQVFTILFLLFFMALTQFTPSVERASIMAIMMLISSIIYRKLDVYNNLAISTVIILLINPYTILDAGFQLSYGGTLGIILLNEKISPFFYKILKVTEENKIKKYIVDLLIVTISANLIIIPIMLFQFNTLSLTFWISNVLAGPFIGIITIMGFVVYIISIFSMLVAQIIAIPLKILLKLLITIAEFSSKIPFSSISVITPNILEIVCYYILIYNVIIKNYKKKITIIVVTTVVIFSNVIGFININKDLIIHFVDVGQGDCTLIITPKNKTILIDGGGSEVKSDFDVGEKTLLPYLLDRRISNIDYMMISHFDSDHVQGLLYILDKINVKNVIISKQPESSENYIKFKNIINKKRINVIFVNKGNKVNIEKDVYMYIIWPDSNDFMSENKLNNNSVVAKFCYKNFSCIFTGDIEKIAEEKIINTYQNQLYILKADILKVGHHGSKTSSTQDFLEKIKPRIALIGVGEKNTFGHPNQNVIDRLNSLGAKVFRTDENGEISIIINNKR